MACIIKKISFVNSLGNILSGRFFSPENLVDSRFGVLLLHGLGTDSGSFGNFPEALAKAGFFALSFDYSGHGQSQGARGLISEKTQKADIEAALGQFKEKGVSNVILLGHSFGCHPALKFSAESAVKKIILVAPQLRSGDSLSFFKKLFFRSFLLAGFLPSYYFAGRGLNLKSLRFLRNADNLKLAGEIKKPILIIGGEKDEEIPVKKIETLFQEIAYPVKKMVILPDTSHNPFLSKESGNFFREINSFLINN